MHASAQAVDEQTPLGCETCGTQNARAARFCKHCGSALVPPAACPSCKAPVSNDARFCSACGAKVVGARPGRPALVVETPARKDSKKPSSNILANVLMFFAALAVFVAVMYAVNKDAPKSSSMFSGGPPAGQMSQRMQEQPNSAAQAVQQAAPAQPSAQGAQGASIKGTIRVAQGTAVPSGGTLFLIARMSGMPAAGPPLAVKKIDSPQFPLEFELGPENVMMQGMPFNGPLAISAKLSQSGNAMAPQPGDLSMSQPKAPVNPGDSSVELVLDKRL